MKAVLFGLLPDETTISVIFRDPGCIEAANAELESRRDKDPAGLFTVAYDQPAWEDKYARDKAAREASYYGPGYEAHPGRDHEDCCK